MSELLNQIQKGSLWPVTGGIHPPTYKAATSHKPIVRPALGEELVIPINQHIGANGTLLVKVGQRVLKGQPLTKPAGNWSLPIHASTSGTISAIEPRPSAHPSGLDELSVILTPDGRDIWGECIGVDDFTQLTRSQIIDRIHQAGIAGMGGAGFPAYVKAATKQPIEVLIVNGVECEPHITADNALMKEHSQGIVAGARILQHVLDAKAIVIAVEDDMPEAYQSMLDECSNSADIYVRKVPTKYPSGGEKQLIEILTGKHVPSGGIPADIGLVVQNVGTLYAIDQAIRLGRPLVERVVTVTGDTVHEPNNLWVPIGTQVKHVLACQGFSPEPMQQVIMGGPMMGFTLHTVRTPIIKTSNCILAPSSTQHPPKGEEQACIRCTACAEACPASLLPQQLQWYAKAKDHEKLEEYRLADCIECGACAYVCPSEIPLVHYYRIAKAEIREAQADRIAAERAKERFEARNARLEREQEERMNKQRSRSAPARSAKEKADEQDKVKAALARTKAKQGDKNDAVAAAIARAKAKKADNGELVPDNSEVAKAREARKAQARQYKAEKDANTTGEPSASDKKAAVAAAIARAKAKKAASSDTDNTHTEHVSSQVADAQEAAPDDKRKAAVAAAIARAKAKKSALDTNSPQTEHVSSQGADAQEAAPEDKRKAAVAAAIARAKAKKAIANEDDDAGVVSELSEEPKEQTPEDKRKAAVAAAIARAKAKKAKASEGDDANTQSDSSVEPSAVANEPSDSELGEAPKEQTPEDKRKAAVAAAIARAKAKKAKAQEEKDNNQ